MNLANVKKVFISLLIILSLIGCSSAKNLPDIQYYSFDSDMLLQLILDGDIGAVRRAVVEGLDVNTPGTDGNMPACYASTLESPEILQVLIDAGADINKKDIQGWTPLMVAVNSNKPDTIDLLLASGAEANRISDGGFTALAVAVWADPISLNTIQKLVEAGADPNFQVSGQIPVLLYPVYSGNIDAVSLLIELGAETGSSESLETTSYEYVRYYHMGFYGDENFDAKSYNLALSRGYYDIATLLLPDSFTLLEDGMLQHTVTGSLFPQAFGELIRRNIIVYNSEASDIGIRYELSDGSLEAEIHIYPTNSSEKTNLEMVSSQYDSWREAMTVYNLNKGELVRKSRYITFPDGRVPAFFGAFTTELLPEMKMVTRLYFFGKGDVYLCFSMHYPLILTEEMDIDSIIDEMVLGFDFSAVTGDLAKID